MRRTITPLFVFALSILVSVSALELIPSAGTVSLLLTALLFSPARVLLATTRYRRGSLLLLSAAAGLVMGSICCCRLAIRTNTVYTGIPADDVSLLRGFAIRDSWADREKSLHRLSLVSVARRSGQDWAGARGEALISDRSGGVFHAGELIELEACIHVRKGPIGRWYSGTTAGGASLGYSTAASRWRACILADLEGRIDSLGAPASGLLKAVFLGRRRDLSGRLSQDLSRTGTVHFLALSGLHVGMLYALVLLLLRPFRECAAVWVLSVMLLAFYVFLAGYRVPLIRAFLACAAGVCAAALDRDRRPLNVLSLVLAAVVFLDPSSVFTVAFRLSFSAVAGILLLGRNLSRMSEPYLPGAIRAPLCGAVGAQTASMPVVMHAFGVYYPIGLIATPLLLPTLAVFLWSGLLYIALTFCPLEVPREALRFLMSRIYGMMAFTAARLSGVDGWRGGVTSAALLVALGAAVLRSRLELTARGNTSGLAERKGSDSRE